MIFQYFPGKGLQLHPLANFGQPNGYWYAHNERGPALAARTTSSTLARRAQRLPHLGVLLRLRRRLAALDLGDGAGDGDAGARAGRQPARRSRAARGRERARGRLRATHAARACASPQGRGDWYALYSFAPRLNVLNGMLQAVIGLRTYADYHRRPAAAALFEPGDRTARARIGSYDTGAWSLYTGPADARARRPTSTTTRSTATSRASSARRTEAQRLLHGGGPLHALPEGGPDARSVRRRARPRRAPARACKFRFTLSKVGRVGIVVGARAARPTSRRARRSRTASTTSAGCRRSASSERTYDYTLSARDLAGNTSSAKGELRVKAARKRKSAAEPRRGACGVESPRQ